MMKGAMKPEDAKATATDGIALANEINALLGGHDMATVVTAMGISLGCVMRVVVGTVPNATPQDTLADIIDLATLEIGVSTDAIKSK